MKFQAPNGFTCGAYIGIGTFGIVRRCHKTLEPKHRYALKRIHSFEDKCLIREVTILKHLNGSPFFVNLYMAYQCDNIMYLMLEHMDIDLHKVIKHFKLSFTHVQFLLYQMLQGIACLHQNNIIHRDLKPSNLLLNSRCDLKIADFGMAREFTSDMEPSSSIMSMYVCTRWYRSPEMLLNCSYGFPSDIWSIGCIFAELIDLCPIFQGDDVDQMLVYIFNTVEVDWLSVKNDFHLSEAMFDAHTKFKSLIKLVPYPIHIRYQKLDKDTQVLLQSLLQFKPNARVTAKEALNNSIFVKFGHPKQSIPQKEYECSIVKEIPTSVQIGKHFQSLT